MHDNNNYNNNNNLKRRQLSSFPRYTFLTHAERRLGPLSVFLTFDIHDCLLELRIAKFTTDVHLRPGDDWKRDFSTAVCVFV